MWTTKPPLNLQKQVLKNQEDIETLQATHFVEGGFNMTAAIKYKEASLAALQAHTAFNEPIGTFGMAGDVLYVVAKTGKAEQLWKELGVFPAVGPQGPQGATGATGPQGAKGDKGDTGLVALEYKGPGETVTSAQKAVIKIQDSRFNRTPVTGDGVLVLLKVQTENEPNYIVQCQALGANTDYTTNYMMTSDPTRIKAEDGQGTDIPVVTLTDPSKPVSNDDFNKLANNDISFVIYNNSIFTKITAPTSNSGGIEFTCVDYDINNEPRDVRFESLIINKTSKRWGIYEKILSHKHMYNMFYQDWGPIGEGYYNLKYISFTITSHSDYPPTSPSEICNEFPSTSSGNDVSIIPASGIVADNNGTYYPICGLKVDKSTNTLKVIIAAAANTELELSDNSYFSYNELI